MITFKVSEQRFLSEYKKRIDGNIENVEWFIDTEGFLNAYITTPSKIYFYQNVVDQLSETFLSENLLKVEGEIRGIVEQTTNVIVEKEIDPMKINLKVND